MKKYVGLILVVGLIFQLNAVAGGTSYTTVNFNYKDWGSYYTVSYAGEPYFAGYVGGGAITSINIFTFNTTSNSGQLHRVLMNDNVYRVLNIGESLPLGEGYQFQIKDIDISAKMALVALLKGATQVDATVRGQQQTYIYTEKVGNVSDLPVIAVHVSNVSNKTVTIDGVFEISEVFITVTPTPISTMNITSWSNNQTNDQSLSITVPLGATRRFSVAYNNNANVFAHSTNGILIGTSCPDNKNCYQDVRFDSPGNYYVSNTMINTTLGSDSKTWYVTVPSVNPTSIPTPTPTPTSIITPPPTSTPTSTLTLTSTATPTPTSTIQIPDAKKRAQLQVTYEVSSVKNGRVIIKVAIKNVGSATASHINLTIDHPSELEAIALSGSEKIGETITWKGELKPYEEHITEYSVNKIGEKDWEIPLKVTYAKISPDEKAKALGVSAVSVNAEQLLTPEDWEVIMLVIKIAKAIAGFEAILAIALLLLVDIILRDRRRN